MINLFHRRVARKSARRTVVARRRLSVERLEGRQLLAAGWHNSLQPGDVNGDELVTFTDLVALVGELRERGPGACPELAPGQQPTGYYDTSNDGMRSVADLLIMVDILRDPEAARIALEEFSALSNHYFVATFDRPATGQLLSPEAYTLLGPDGTRLPILEVFAGSDPKSVILATASQQLVDYTLQARVSDVLVGEGEAVGTSNPEPWLQSAIALSSTSVLLTFSDSISIPTAQTAAFYRIAAGDGATPSEDLGHVRIESAVRQANKRTVLLTTSPMENIEYSVKATNLVHALNSMFIDPTRNTSSFFGLPHSEGLEFISAVSTSPTTILLNFSEPLDPNTIDLSDFVVTYIPQDGLPPPLPLVVTGFELDETGTQITLTTFPQPAGAEITVEVSGLLDIAGNELPPASSQTFQTLEIQAPPEEALPRVVGAAAFDNTTVLVAFSRPMGPSALVPQHYVIVQENENPEAGALLVIGAEYLSDDNHATIKLTTVSQSELTYTLTAVNVRDEQGQPLAPPITNNGVLVNPTRASFPGSPYSGTEIIDSDGDGLSDSAEQRGWTAAFTLLDGTLVTRGVTSDPFNEDTDGDGFLDSAEAALRLDPRDPDTDDDLLIDEFEFNVIYSSPADQDTDNDGLDDGLEFDFFRTSPLLADTDGDRFLDGDEAITQNRNPRIADLPQVKIDPGNVDLRLDVRFEAQDTQGTTVVDSKSVESSLNQSSEDAFSDSTTNTFEWFFEAGAELCIAGACDTEKVAGFGLHASGGASGGTTTTYTTESSRATSREYATSLSTDKEVSAESVVTRTVEGAAMAVAINIENTSNVAFTISNIEITALLQDPRDPTQLTPVATLFAASDEPITIGPLAPKRGPFRFTAQEAFPQLVESLMSNPRGLIFKVANYQIVDEFGRNFGFVEQDVNDRTAFLEINYAGNQPLERFQVATNSIFDEDGKAVGVTMQEIMENILGLTFVPEADDVLLDPNDFDDAELLDNSYSTRMKDGVEVLWRVKDVSRELTGTERDWWVITPQGLITPIDGNPGQNFNEFVVHSDQDFAFKFVQDLDGDGLEADEEAFYRSIDSKTDTAADPDMPDSKDTDNDGIKDADEVYGFFVGNERVGWTIRPEAQDAYKTFASPGRRDTDFDGLTDAQELGLRPIQVYLDADGVPTLESEGNVFLTEFTLSAPTDPSSPDTDGDGLPDAVEVAGFRYVDLLGDEVTIEPTVTDNPDPDPDTGFATNPLARDTDGDGLADLQEIQLGTNPTVPDGDTVLDDDGDGLVNLQETTGWSVTYRNLVGTLITQSVVSMTDDPDSDNDGLTDWEEFMGCRDANDDLVCDTEERFGPTNPSNADTDGDSLNDRVEVDGVDFAFDTATPFRFTDPRNADTDADGRSDSAEVNTPWTVQVVGAAAQVVFSDPTKADKDGDGLSDSTERTLGSHPDNADTDGDGALDGLENARITNILQPDRLVTVFYRGLQTGTDAGTANTDGDAGLDAGDFNFNFQVGVPASSGALSFISVVNSASIDLPACTLGNTENFCTYEEPGPTEVVQIQASLKLVMNESYSFAVPLTDIFTVEGFVQEIDGGFADISYFYGGIGAPSGVYAGSDLKIGSFGILFENNPTDANDAKFRITVQVKVE